MDDAGKLNEEELKKLVREFFERNTEGSDDKASDPDAIPRFIAVLLQREKELMSPEPERGTLDWYFHPDSSRDLKKASRDASFALLKRWASSPTAESD